MRARQIHSAHHLRPAGKMLGSHSHTAFPSAHCIRAAKAIHDPQYIDHAIERGSRNSSCRATAKWAHHWLPGASSPVFKARTRFPFRHQPTSPHYARACAGPAPITISRRRWAASALSYVQGGVGGQSSRLCSYRPWRPCSTRSGYRLPRRCPNGRSGHRPRTSSANVSHHRFHTFGRLLSGNGNDSCGSEAATPLAGVLRTPVMQPDSAPKSAVSSKWR